MEEGQCSSLASTTLTILHILTFNNTLTSGQEYFSAITSDDNIVHANVNNVTNS